MDATAGDGSGREWGLLLLGLALILAGALVESRAILLVTAGSGAFP